MQAFGVFEGGGVRGYAHFGALHACEDRGIEFVGVAGTSIGAIVAALVAVGYTSAELYEVDDKDHEKGLFAVNVVKAFLDEQEFRRLDRFGAWRRKSSDRLTKGRASLADFGKTPFGRACAKFPSIRRRAIRSLEAASVLVLPLYTLGLSVALPHWRLLRTIWGQSGALDSGRFTTWLNDRLSERLGMMPGSIVTFSDVPMPLAFVATNLSQRSLALFDKASHPAMSVAEAAMASATYPLVFRPRHIDGEVFVDGGLLSNFPAWALDEARAEQDRIVPTFGFRVVDEPGPEKKKWPGDQPPHFIAVSKRIVDTAMWGRGKLESRRIDDLHPMEVTTHVKSTDFHAIAAERAGLYRKGRDCVRDYFVSRLGPRDPSEMEMRLLRLRDIIRNVTNARGTIRAYLIQPTDPPFARVVYSALNEGDPDDELSFRRGSASQMICLDRREPVLMRVADLDEAQRRAPPTKLIHALRPTSVTHAYCVPMFGKRSDWSEPDPRKRSDPIAALCVDFEDADDRLLLDPDVEDVFAALGDALVDLWMDRNRQQAAELERIEAPASGDWVGVDGCSGYFVSTRTVRSRPADHIQEQIDRATY